MTIFKYFKYFIVALLIATIAIIGVSAEDKTLEDLVNENAQEQESVETDQNTENYNNSIAEIAEQSKIDIDSESVSKYTEVLSSVVGKFVAIAVTVIVFGAIVMGVLDIVYITFPFSRCYLRSDYNGSVYNANNSGSGTVNNVSRFPMRSGGSLGDRVVGEESAFSGERRSSYTNGRQIKLCSDMAVKAVMNAESSRSNVYSEYFKKMWGMYPAIIIILVLLTSGIMYTVGFKVAEWIIEGVSMLINGIEKGF